MINNRKKGTDFFSIRRRITSTCSNNKRRSPTFKALLLYIFFQFIIALEAEWFTFSSGFGAAYDIAFIYLYL